MKHGTRFATMLMLTLLSHTQTRCTKQKSNQDVWITIFIHGTVSAILRRPNLNLFFTLLHDRVDGSRYKRATAYARKDPAAPKEQAVQGLGLQPINKTDIAPGKAATALALLFDKLDFWTNNRKGNLNYYYTEGWSGLVSRKERYKEAKRFHKELADLVAQFHKRGISPKIRIIGYSHGGNVALNLARVEEKEKSAQKVIIDELILLGMPIFNRALKSVNHPMFLNVYNIYSESDGVQKLDFTLPGTAFSERYFHGTKRKKLPDKLVQIRLKMVRNRTTCKKWKKCNDPRCKTEKNVVLYGKANLLRDISPAHNELWFFDWVRAGYRDRIPLKPLPIVALLPLILDEAKKCKLCPKTHLVVELRPEHEQIILNSGKGRFVRPLLTEKKLNDLKKLAYRFKVKKRSQKSYNQLIKSALKKATEEMKAEKIKKLSSSELIPQLQEVIDRQLLSTFTEHFSRNNRSVKVCLF